MVRIPADLAQTLIAVLDEGTLEAAARRLHVTPSAVSQRIKTLEESVGRVLLVRTKPVRATEAAYPVVRYARQLALLEADASAALGDADGVVRMSLAVNADSLSTWFLPPLGRLAERHPVVFDLHRDDQDFTAALLESGTVTGAVTSRAQPVAGCRVVGLGELVYEAVATPAFRDRWLATTASGDVEPFRRAPLIDFDRRDDLQTRWLRQCGVDPDAPPRHRVPASHDFATAVQLGLGWALLPRLQAQAALDAGTLVALAGPPMRVPLYWQQWNLRSPLLDAVADEIVDEGRRVLAAPISRPGVSSR